MITGDLLDTPCPKLFRDGTHRIRPPEETLAQYWPVGRQLGVTRISNITGLDCIGLPVCMAVRPASRSLATAHGKGISLAAAQASALMESIELWHAENARGQLRQVEPRTLRSSALVPDLSLFPARRPSHVRDDVPMLMIEAHDLLSDTACWLPFDCVSLNFVLSPGADPIFAMNSNGLASGNHALEAVLHGLCELIERDCVARWYELDDQAIKARQIDPASIADGPARGIMNLLARAQVETGIWSIGDEWGIPVFVAMIFDHPDASHFRPLGLFRGSGCHPSAEVALLRALSEAVQSRLTYISGSRDDVPPETYSTRPGPEELEGAHRELWTPPPTLSISSVRHVAGDSIDVDVRTVLALFRSQGIPQVIAVDLTDPVLGLPVVKMAAPGLGLRGMPGARQL